MRPPLTVSDCKGPLTPSFSLCMMIFFRATKAPVFFDLARWTSLAAVLEGSESKMAH